MCEPWFLALSSAVPVLTNAPLLTRIYVTRTALATFFNFRVDTLASRLKDQQAERSKTIQKLKDATKYDSTQKILEKYGGVEKKSPKGKREGDDGAGKESKQPRQGAGAGAGGTPAKRTNMPPPPTANIRHGDTASPTPAPATGPATPLRPSSQQRHEAGPWAGFAPNAFGPDGPPPSLPNSQYAAAPPAPSEARWYDRILDLLLGEDEAAAKNRIVLICSRCRLVNGQAPPGTKSLSEIGMWRCMGCGATNGEMDEGKRIVKEVLGESTQAKDAPTEDTPDGDSGKSVVIDEEGDGGKSGDEPAGGPTEDTEPEHQEGLRKRSKKG